MERTHSKAVACRPGEEAAGGPGQARWWLAERAIPHSCADKLGETTGRGGDRLAQPRVPVRLNKASKPLTVNTLVEAAAGETPSLIGQFIGETYRVLECTQAHPPGNKHQKAPI